MIEEGGNKGGMVGETNKGRFVGAREVEMDECSRVQREKRQDGEEKKISQLRKANIRKKKYWNQT